MKEVAAFLQHCKPFYLATMDGDNRKSVLLGLFVNSKINFILSRRTKKPCIVR